MFRFGASLVVRLMPAVLLPLLAVGCLAQQADLRRVSQDLDKKIAKLDQKEKDLAEAIERANQAGAKLHQDVSELRDDDVAQLRGGLDKSAHERTAMRSRLDDLDHQVGRRLAALEQAAKDQAAAQKTERERMQQDLEKLNAGVATLSAGLLSATKELDGRLQDHDKALAAGDAQRQALTQQADQVGKALEEFKVALNGLGDKVVQQDQRVAGFAEKADTDAKATTVYLADVNKSLASMAKALETLGANLAAKTEEQDRRIDDLSKAVQTGPKPRNGKDQSGAKHGMKAGEDLKAHHAAGRQEPLPQESVAAGAAPSVAAAAGAVSGKENVQADGGGASPTNDRAAYAHAMQQFKQGDWDGALQGFASVLAQQPTSQLASNAQYWVGECYYGKKDYAQAVAAYDRVKLLYPSSEKVPAALLKKGFAYLAMKDQENAVLALRQVVDAYPKSSEAGKASDKLAQLKQSR